MVVAVGVVRRVAVAVVPDQLDGRPVDRHRHRAGLGRDRVQVVEARRPPSGRRRTRAPRGRRGRAPAPARRRTRAARSRRPSGRSGAGATRSRWRAGGAARRRWPAAAAARGWPTRSTARPGRARRTLPAGRGRGARRPAPRARSRRRPGAPRRPAPASLAALQAGGVLGVDGRADLAQEAAGSGRPSRRAWPRAGRTAPASGRRSRARRRAAPAAAGRRRRPPPTATPRRTARCRSPRRTACGSAAPAPGRRAARSSQHRDEVQRAIERPLAQREVARRDGRREAVVERLGDAEPGVHPVPARPQRELVDPQLAGVEEAVQLDVVVDALAQRAELARRGTRADARGCPTCPPPGAPASAGSGSRRRRPAPSP